jgi:hypothetical protein
MWSADESGVLTTPVRFAAITDASSGQQAFFQVSLFSFISFQQCST